MSTSSRRLFKRKAIAFLILLSPFISLEAWGETSANDWIARLGNITFSTAGGVFLPSSVLQGLSQGKVSPIMQFVVANHTMNACIENVAKYAPDRKDPFVVATAKFNSGVCRIKKCFQTQMLLLLLPALSDVPKYGGSTNGQSKSGNSALGVALAQGFQKDELCDKSGQGIDPALIGLFTAASR